jgi:16S rRNA (guanine1516-N2)-methyltransferase
VKVPLAVTVTATTPGRYQAEARAKAEEWRLPYFERAAKSSMQLMLETQADALFVLAGDGWSLTDAHGSLQFSLGLAHLRIGRLQHQLQQPDQMVQVSGLKEGDSVIDCTLGLGADALVCAHVVGSTGRVIGVEASHALFLLVQTGLERLRGEGSELRTTTPRRSAQQPSVDLTVVHSTAHEFLRTQSDKSADLVFFDPMFSTPKKSSAAFEVLRRYAIHQPLDEATLHEARRVARRQVVIKTGPLDKSLQHLGLTPKPTTRYSTFWWAVVPPL